MSKILFSKKFISLFGAVVFLTNTVLYSQTEIAKSEVTSLKLSTSEKLTKELDDMVNTNEYYKVPGIGVIIYKDGKEVYSHFAGRAYIDEKNPANDRPLTRNTRFRIASISKQFTAITIMQLVEEGKIKLDADAGEYLGYSLRNPNFPDVTITVRMLLAHTSSIRDGMCYNIPPYLSLKECFNPKGKFWENGAHFASKAEEPGIYFCYSNLNYILLGAIIEKVTGERFDIYQKKHVLSQLDTKADYVAANMEDTEFNNLAAIYQKSDDCDVWNEHGSWFAKCDDFSVKPSYKDAVESKNSFAVLYDFPGKYSTVYSFDKYKVGENPSFLGPQGSLRISLPEIGNMLMMFGNCGKFNEYQVLQPDSIKEMCKAQWTYDPKLQNGKTYGDTLLKYGLGTILIDGDTKAKGCEKYKVDLVGHTGECYGLLAGAYRFVAKPQDGFVFTVNGEAVQEDNDPRSSGIFSSNYIWEEKIMDSIIQAMVEDKTE